MACSSPSMEDEDSASVAFLITRFSLIADC